LIETLVSFWAKINTLWLGLPFKNFAFQFFCPFSTFPLPLLSVLNKSLILFMRDNQTKVICWIKSGMDYTKGVDLLVEITRKQMFYNLFTGKDIALADKLAYEICKAALVADHVNWKDFIRKVQNGNFETANLTNDCQDVKMLDHKPSNETNPKICVPDSETTTETLETAETIETKPLSEYPTIIRRIIHEYAALFQERSKLHSVMVEMPESNAESVCAKRAELFDLIKSISARLEILYSAKREFDEKGIIPEESSVFPPVGKEEAEPDITSLDEATLKKQKKNLQSSNSKDQTILEYQSKERTEIKTPMPNGPKRAKIEMRIAERNKKIEEIETLLLKYAGKE